MPSSVIKRPSLVTVWLRAVRGPSLTTTLIPVLLGGGFALVDRGFDGWSFLITLIAALLLQAGTNLINDYYDHIKGADVADTLSPSNVLHKGWLTPRQVYYGGLTCFLLASLLGIYLVSVGGWFILLLGLVGLAAGYLYTGTRIALAYHGLGEITVFLLMGPLMVLGTYYVMVRLIYVHVIVNAIPIGLLAAAILHANNLRDLEHDRRIGKHTIATMLGRRYATWEYHGLVLAAYGTMIVLWLRNDTPATALLSLLAFPLAVYTMYIVRKTADPMELNLVLGLAELHQLLFGILNVFGIYLFYFLQT
jgi:1,4-dihydroxy-2-naphthoate polyprenyltransferase